MANAIADRAVQAQGEPSAIEEFRSTLKAGREPEIVTVTSLVGGLIILWSVMFKPLK